MLSFNGNLKVYVALKPCGMRKSFNGLAAVARNTIGMDPGCGAAFLFTNQRRNFIKTPERLVAELTVEVATLRAEIEQQKADGGPGGAAVAGMFPVHPTMATRIGMVESLMARGKNGRVVRPELRG